MKYEEARELMMTGDALLCRGSAFIRCMTGEGYGHVAILVWQEDGLWVFEFTARHGYRATPASQWFAERKGQEVWWGEAPIEVRARAIDIRAAALAYRDQRPLKRRYGFFTLALVWMSQITGVRFKHYLEVCSTFFQEMWEAASYKWQGNADPGNVARACETLTMVDG